MRKSAMSRHAIGTAMLLIVSWWFLLSQGIQVGPFSSGAACAKVGQAFNGVGDTYVLGNICFSNTGLTVPVPPPS